MRKPDNPDTPERDELSQEISGAVDGAKITDTFTIGEGIMRVVNTAPYPKGEHPLEKMGRPTKPYPVRLRTLMIELCGGDPAIDMQKAQMGGVPCSHMGEDNGTGVPKEMITDQDEVHEVKTGEYEVIGRITQPLGTGDYEVISEGEVLAHEIAREVTLGAKTALHEMETEKIETDEDKEHSGSMKAEIFFYFDQQINTHLKTVLPDERLRVLMMLNAIRNEICDQVVDMPESINRNLYILSLKNAIKYIVDSVMKNGINKSITLEIPNV